MTKDYQIVLIRSDRKTLSLRIAGPDRVEVRAPRKTPKAQIDQFVSRHQGWIEKHLRAAARRREAPPFTEAEIRALSDQALRVLPQKAARFAPMVGVQYGRITIRSQKTKWGSCSAKGSLNFNCLLMLCPEKAQDYVVIHELCHLIEMNHSPRFWAQVERVMPDWKRWRQWLKTEGEPLIDRLKASKT